MNKSFAVVLGVVGMVSAIAGASPAMAHYKATGIVTPGSAPSTGNVNATAAGSFVHYSLSIATGATSASMLLTPTGFTVQQSLLAIDCNTGTASTYSVATGTLTIACPAFSTVANNAQAFISVN